MIGVVVVAHGDLAGALLETARSVVPTPSAVAAVAIRPGDDSALFSKRLEEAIGAVRQSRGVMVLTDMFGGTPANVGLALHRPNEIEVLTGVSLPMVIKALQLCEREVDLVEAAAQVRVAGQQAIRVASELLSGKGGG